MLHTGPVIFGEMEAVVFGRPAAEVVAEEVRRREADQVLLMASSAVNRVADAAGLRTALYAGLDVVVPLYATRTELGAKFREIVAAEGVPAAVRWRRAQFEK